MAAVQLAVEARGTQSLRVAIVGGGVAGLISCRYLRDAGHRPELFEAGKEIGGIWTPEPTNTVVYKGLITNVPTCVMQSLDLDFPSSLPSYIRGTDLGDYILQYAECFGLKPFMHVNTPVKRVRPLQRGDQQGEPAWEVVWTDEGKVQEGEFDAVVVATGHCHKPFVPEILGQSEWLEAASPQGSRTVSHAHAYDEPSIFAGRSVLVVGGRFSASDIARELLTHVSWLYMLESGCERVQSGYKCTHLPLSAKLGADGLVYVGGEAVRGLPVDHLVFATGYMYEFPFLDSNEVGLEFGDNARYVAPLHQHIVHARFPSLCFVGIPSTTPSSMLLFEAQAHFVAAHLRGDELASTTVAIRDEWVAARRKSVGSRKQAMHVISADALWKYMRELHQKAGMQGAEYEAYCRRLMVIREIYMSRCDRAPDLPWGDDDFRSCQYSVDWAAGTWQVVCPRPF